MIERYKHHGQEVYVISAVKGKHRDHCLCHQGCKHFAPGEPHNCQIAQDNFRNCLKHSTVQPVYECPQYEAGGLAHQAEKMTARTFRTLLFGFLLGGTVFAALGWMRP